jgi:hypothetical protein
MINQLCITSGGGCTCCQNRNCVLSFGPFKQLYLVFSRVQRALLLVFGEQLSRGDLSHLWPLNFLITGIRALSESANALVLHVISYEDRRLLLLTVLRSSLSGSVGAERLLGQGR